MCGSGKTEVVLSIISYVIENGGKVGFVIPRRDVVIEIYLRLKYIFKRNTIVAVYGNHHEILEADIICLTSHQLFRYKEYFDLVIFDEIDAFPYKENYVLNALFFRSIRGNYVQMSATPSKKVLDFFRKENRDILTLSVRYHHNPIPVPKIINAKYFIKYIYLYKYLKRFEKQNKPVFVFFPTIDNCEDTYNKLKLFFKKVNYIHSKRKDRESVINHFRKGHTKILFTTAVLERGVTIKDLQVIIFNADNSIYDSAALIQISGRVGRKKDAPEGEVIYISEKTTKAMEESIRNIKAANRDLQNMLKGSKP